MNTSSALTPMEMLASQYRTTTHDTQRQLRKIIRAFIEVKNGSKETAQPFLEMLSQGKQQLLSLKRKLSQRLEEQFRLYDICKKRIHHHEELKQDAYKRKQFEFNSQIIQYLRSRGKFDKARELSKALQQQELFHLQTSLLQKAMEISNGIQQNDLCQIKQWIYENSHNLSKVQSEIYFHMTSCEYLNFIEQGQNVKACIYLRENLQQLKLSSKQHKQVQRLTYLLIDPQKHKAMQGEALAALQQTFKKCFSEIYLINLNSQLQRNLVVGISSLKTVCCCKEQTKNEEICPICSDRVSKLSQKIPMLTKESSVLKCRINHSIMNEQNYPLALPNGNIYSLSGLTETSRGDSYFCMNTQTQYPKSQAKRVYLA